MYDRMNPLTVPAEVVSFEWVNPHSTLTGRRCARGRGKRSKPGGSR